MKRMPNCIGTLRLGAWRVGRRQERALQILDGNGQPWDVVTRNELLDPALFILLAADRREARIAAGSCRKFDLRRRRDCNRLQWR